MTMYEQESVHDAVGAYVLGVLDDADASAFEMHLAGCDICAAHLEEFSKMAPMLAMLAEAPAPPVRQSNVLNMPGRHAMPGAHFPTPRQVPVAPRAPGSQLLGGLLDEIAAKRALKRRRGMYLVAAAAALILGGPAAAVVVTADDDGSRITASPVGTAEGAFKSMDEKVTATDATTKVSATVGMQETTHGIQTVLELKNVKGPLKCTLVLKSKTGEEEVLGSWAVGKWGYGIPDSPNELGRKPLYFYGGAATTRNDVASFEVRTTDGKRLVEVNA